MKNVVILALTVALAIVWNSTPAMAQLIPDRCVSIPTPNQDLGPDEYDEGRCPVTPDVMRIRLYELGVCTEPSSPSATNSCTTFFQSSDGRVLDIGSGRTISLSDDMSIPDGVYGYTYLKFDAEISIRVTTDNQALFGSKVTATNGTNGDFCWTNGIPVYYDSSTGDRSNVTCGDQIGQPAFSTNVVTIYPNGPDDETAALGIPYSFEGETVITDFYSLDGEGNLAAAFPLDETGSRLSETIENYENASSFETNASFVWGHQTLTPPLTINEKTDAIDTGILVTDGITFDFTNTFCELGTGGLCGNQFNPAFILFRVSAQQFD